MGKEWQATSLTWEIIVFNAATCLPFIADMANIFTFQTGKHFFYPIKKKHIFDFLFFLVCEWIPFISKPSPNTAGL